MNYNCNSENVSVEYPVKQDMVLICPYPDFGQYHIVVCFDKCWLLSLAS